jgi:hypothetical protein
VTTSPASGFTFPVGTTTVTNTVTDAHGNTQTSTFTVTVNDTEKPVVSPHVSITAFNGPGQCSAAVGFTITVSDNCPGVTYTTTPASGAPFPVGTTPVQVTATDAHGNTQTSTFFVTVVDNTLPVIAAANISVPTSAGLCTATVSSLNATATDNCSATLTGSRSDGQPLASPYPKGTTTITWVATDPSANSSTITQTVTVTNPPPVASITAPASGFIVGVGQTVAFAGSFTDNAGDIHTVTWSVDAINFAGTVNEAAKTTAGSYTFSTAGVYAVKMTVKDQCNQTSVATTVGGVDAMIVVYDPSAGFVTGGGWINSPAGAYVPDPTLTGKANFGFVSKYKKGQTQMPPDGETEFQFKEGSLNFHSTSYDWLVIAGARAQFKGSGTINDAGSYGFLLTSLDGQMPGGGGKDKFRMKITNKTTGIVIYDSQMGAADSSAASTVLGGGEIVIHTSGGLMSASAPGSESGAPAKNALYQNAPNPFNPATSLRFALVEPGRVTLRVYSVRGELVKTLKDEWLPPGVYQVSWDGRDRNGRAVSSGAYFAMISTDRGYRDRIRMVLLK